MQTYSMLEANLQSKAIRANQRVLMDLWVQGGTLTPTVNGGGWTPSTQPNTCAHKIFHKLTDYCT